MEVSLMIEKVNLLLNHYGINFEIEALSLDEKNQCVLVDGNDHEILIELDADFGLIHFCAELCATPQDSSELSQLYKILSDLNFCGKGTLGGCVGIDPDCKFIVFSRSYELGDISDLNFNDKFESFMDTVIDFRDKFETLLGNHFEMREEREDSGSSENTISFIKA